MRVCISRLGVDQMAGCMTSPHISFKCSLLRRHPKVMNLHYLSLFSLVFVESLWEETGQSHHWPYKPYSPGFSRARTLSAPWFDFFFRCQFFVPVWMNKQLLFPRYFEDLFPSRAVCHFWPCPPNTSLYPLSVCSLPFRKGIHRLIGELWGSSHVTSVMIQLL